MYTLRIVGVYTHDSQCIHQLLHRSCTIVTLPPEPVADDALPCRVGADDQAAYRLVRVVFAFKSFKVPLLVARLAFGSSFRAADLLLLLLRVT